MLEHSCVLVRISDSELARRSILRFGELVAALGRGALGENVVVRRPNALGAPLECVNHNPWFDAAVVPLGAPPTDDPLLPGCLLTTEDAVPGRVEDPSIATPCLGVALDDLAFPSSVQAGELVTPSLEVLGNLNERAYGDAGTFSPLIRALNDERVSTYGWLEGDTFACVPLTLQVDDNLKYSVRGHRRGAPP
ncbi:hypothetical protein ACFFLM_06550 [Deinococcus oregonensis]|uniref:Uncharacterized protein n=1 Tax=Deinococcus oregonensis TaxID=1805970 RepID=A0ABV6AVU4_9DEIO